MFWLGAINSFNLSTFQEQTRIDTCRESLTKHRFHIDKLETILRMVDNGAIQFDEVSCVDDGAVQFDKVSRVDDRAVRFDEVSSVDVEAIQFDEVRHSV